MATVFQNILKKAEDKGIVNKHSSEAIEWFRKNIRKTAVEPSRLIREERANLVNSWTNVGPGQVYFAMYDPKHKATLPYYDTFPIIIPIERYNDGILSMNLHYLPPILRAQLLDALYDTATDDRMTPETRMKVSYSIMNSASKFRLFKPCIKRYLGDHFRSRFLRVPVESWTSAIFLPVENFQKASKQKVWKNSRSIIRGV